MPNSIVTIPPVGYRLADVLRGDDDAIGDAARQHQQGACLEKKSPDHPALGSQSRAHVSPLVMSFNYLAFRCERQFRLH